MEDEAGDCREGATAKEEGVEAAGESLLRVGDLSRFGRGRHTTRTVSLIPLPRGGLLADTPGFNQPSLDGVTAHGLARLFPDLSSAADAGGGCRFSDCLHLAEPGCAVRGAELERHALYIKMLREIKAREEGEVRELQAAKRAREGAVKTKTGRGGRQRLEARLEARKHRVASRRTNKQAVVDNLDNRNQEEDVDDEET